MRHQGIRQLQRPGEDREFSCVSSNDNIYQEEKSMKENKRKVKKRYRQKARQFISGLLITAMLAPNMTPIIAQAAELIENQPRYVDFTRPQALTLRELGIESGVSDTSDGDRADRTENRLSFPDIRSLSAFPEHFLSGSQDLLRSLGGL